MPNLDQADLLFPALVGLAFGCLFPAAVFLVLWITGGLNGESARDAITAAAAVTTDAEPNMDEVCLNWLTRNGV